MKAIILASAIVLSTAPAIAAAPRVYLECKGHNVINGFPTEHEIAINGAKAEIDGHPYQLSVSQTEFTLTGPTPVNDKAVYINRLTGEWAMTPSNLNDQHPNGKLESSGHGEGCEKMDRKF